MNWFDHNDTERVDRGCICKDDTGIFLDKRQISRISALLLLIGVFIFIGGYFWGQRVATDQLLNVVERDSFADQIYYSMSSMYDLKDDESNEPDVVSGEDESEQSSEQRVAQDSSSKDGAPEWSSSAAPAIALATAGELGGKEKHELAASTYSSVPLNKKAEHTKEYFAQLVGFGYERPAQQLVGRLRAQGLTVLCQKRQSKSAKGKVVSWYQVVTPRYADKNALLAAIDKIKKYEKIHDVRVVEVGVS